MLWFYSRIWGLLVFGILISERKVSQKANSKRGIRLETGIEAIVRGFPDGPVVKTPCFQCRGLGFDPFLGN